MTKAAYAPPGHTPGHTRDSLSGAVFNLNSVTAVAETPMAVESQGLPVFSGYTITA